jgi:hypothetical protein
MEYMFVLFIYLFIYLNTKIKRFPKRLNLRCDGSVLITDNFHGRAANVF